MRPAAYFVRGVGASRLIAVFKLSVRTITVWRGLITRMDSNQRIVGMVLFRIGTLSRVWLVLLRRVNVKFPTAAWLRLAEITTKFRTRTLTPPADFKNLRAGTAMFARIRIYLLFPVPVLTAQ